MVGWLILDKNGGLPAGIGGKNQYFPGQKQPVGNRQFLPAGYKIGWLILGKNGGLPADIGGKNQYFQGQKQPVGNRQFLPAGYIIANVCKTPVYTLKSQ